jgi:hypothetical protein
MDFLKSLFFGDSVESRGYDPMKARDPMSFEEPLDEEAIKKLEEARKREAIKQKLRDVIERLKEKEAMLIRRYEEEDRNAQTFARQGKKQSAVSAFQKRNLYRKNIEKIRKEQIAAESQFLHLESTEVTRDTMHALKEANECIRDENKKRTAIKVEDVQDIMVDINQSQAEHEMVGDIMSSGIDVTEEDAEEDLEEFLKSIHSADKSYVASSSSSSNNPPLSGRIPSTSSKFPMQSDARSGEYKTLDAIQEELW